jgi:hypothetical protein
MHHRATSRATERWAILFLIGIALGAAGCTRQFYRKNVDREVDAVLRQKEVNPFWKIENYHVYPDPKSRFADPFKPDRPPMPPDDPGAYATAPNPQKPRHAGVKWYEGEGYLELLQFWDEQNRAFAGPPPKELPAELPEPNAVHKVQYLETPKPGANGEVPFLLKSDQAVELALLNSREYQTRCEELYLAALPVTLERFSFAAQFFDFEQAIYERTGAQRTEGNGDRWRLNSAAGVSKLLPSGALVLAAFANRTVIDMSAAGGPKTRSISTINLDAIQPLLLGAGKAVTLEPLTQAERNLLYEVREYARFRKEFFQFITGGSDLTGSTNFAVGGLGGGIAIGNLNLGTGNNASLIQRPGSAGRIFLATGNAAPSEGYYNTLLRRSILAIQRENVKRLEKILRLFAAFEEGGRVSSLQVGQVQLQLLQAQADLLRADQDLRDSLDRLKLQLGLPMTVPLELDPEIVKPILTQYQAYEETLAQFDAAVADVDRGDAIEEANKLRDRIGRILKDSPLVRATKRFRESIPARWTSWSREQLDDKAADAKLTKLRRERNELLDLRDAREEKGEKLSDEEARRLTAIQLDLPIGAMEMALRRYEAMPWKNAATEKGRREEHVARFRELRALAAEVLSEATNERFELVRKNWPLPAPIMIGGLDILNSELEPAYQVGAETALSNRLDLMNTRAQAVDAWRQVAVFANSLLGVFNVGYHLDSTTPADGSNPIGFSGSRTRHQVIFNAELPLVRVAERNSYRASLIALQRARRNVMAAEDTVANQVRADIRLLQVIAKNLKIQQQAVELAYQQVESSLETFQAPQAPGDANNAASAAALTQQLLNAYRGLPQSQSQLITLWVNYQIARQQLFLDLELMPLDARGVWIDELTRLEGVPADPGLLPAPR